MNTSKKVIRLQWAGEDPGYCRTYFEDVETGEYYTLTESSYLSQGIRTWHTTDCIDGEPDMPLEDGIIIDIISDGQVVSREVISCVDGGDSVGLPVPFDFDGSDIADDLI